MKDEHFKWLYSSITQFLSKNHFFNAKRKHIASSSLQARTFSLVDFKSSHAVAEATAQLHLLRYLNIFS